MGFIILANISSNNNKSFDIYFPQQFKIVRTNIPVVNKYKF